MLLFAKKKEGFIQMKNNFVILDLVHFDMRKLLLFVLLVVTASSFAQEDAWVYFADKPNADNYLANPLQMLSQRSLDRRIAQDIPLDMKDVPIGQSYVDQIAAVSGISVKAKSKWLNAVHIRGSVEDITALTTFSFVSQIVFADHSLNAALAGRAAKHSEVRAVNKMLDTQVSFAYGNSQNQIEMLKGNLLHQQGYTGSGKIIAVLDAGFPGVDTAQPFQRLWTNGQILGGHNFVSDNDNIFSATSHGTMVLSTMGGYVEDQLVGTAPDASYYLFITEDSGSENPVEESYWVEAAETADSLGVDVINTSLGYFIYDNPNYSYTYPDMNGSTSFISKGADIAFSRGMIVVVSAGNSGASESNPHIGSPADAVNVLTVGAVSAAEGYAPFSSIGPSADSRVKPDVMAQGVAAVVSSPEGQIQTVNGTSFSGPITAGLVASLWQALPDLTNSELVDYIKKSADLYNNPNDHYGYGIPDFSLALTDAMAVPTFDKTQFILYPNPAVDQISIDFPDEIATAEITLSTIIGQLVLSQTVTGNSPAVTLGKLEPGIYIYKIQSGSYTNTGKLIKKK